MSSNKYASKIIKNYINIIGESNGKCCLSNALTFFFSDQNNLGMIKPSRPRHHGCIPLRKEVTALSHLIPHHFDPENGRKYDFDPPKTFQNRPIIGRD